MGQFRAFLMWSGTNVVGLYENLTEKKGLKPLVAMSVLCVGGMVLGLVLIVVVGVLCMPKTKQD